MIGAITGDVIGSIYEHANIKTKSFELFDPRCFFTDDTVMSLALAEAIVQGNDYAAAFRQFHHWYPTAGYGKMFRAWANDATMGPYQSYGNGSAMRVTAVSFAYDTRAEVLDKARESAAVSHDHPEGIKGAQAMALATYLARKGKTKSDIVDAVIDLTGYNLDFTIDGIRSSYKFDVSCQGSVPQAIVAFRDCTDVEDAIRSAISIGGDSDTIASMAAAIAAPFYGMSYDMDTRTRYRLDDRLLAVLTDFENRFMND